MSYNITNKKVIVRKQIKNYGCENEGALGIYSHNPIHHFFEGLAPTLFIRR